MKICKGNKLNLFVSTYTIRLRCTESRSDNFWSSNTEVVWNGLLYIATLNGNDTVPSELCFKRRTFQTARVKSLCDGSFSLCYCFNTLGLWLLLTVSFRFMTAGWSCVMRHRRRWNILCNMTSFRSLVAVLKKNKTTCVLLWTQVS